MIVPQGADCDVLIIGGGPAGSTAAMVLARAGVSVTVLERTRFPRFHVGESFLPLNFALIQELGLESRLRKLPHMPKFGAEFAMGNGTTTTLFPFNLALDGGRNETFNIERACFDRMLLDAARDDGATVREEATVKRIVHLADGDVAVEVDGRELRARYLLDASGQATFVGRHLGTRRVFAHHRKVAYFGHFENVWRREGNEEGYPTVVMCDEGWFWLIPIDERRTSIGLVMDADAARTVDVPAQKMLFWGIEHCPFVAGRTARAKFPENNHVIADFSYTCKPYAGPGYFLIGDAAVFLDPIFSTGICLGMVGAKDAAELIVRILRHGYSPRRARRRYCRTVHAGSSVFFRLVNLYHDHAFRELFLRGQGPLQVHRAVISVLAGHVFPRPRFAVRWRMHLFEWIIRIQRRYPLVPRHERFSILGESAALTPARGGR
jgi:flavin-dependent dehydrogenase